MPAISVSRYSIFCLYSAARDSVSRAVSSRALARSVAISTLRSSDRSLAFETIVAAAAANTAAVATANIILM